MKTTKKEIIECTSKVLPELGFKFLKTKCTGTKKSSCFNYYITVEVDGNTFFYIDGEVKLLGIRDFVLDVLNIKVCFEDILLSVLTDHAYPSELKNVEREFYGCFYMYLNHPLPANQLEAYDNLLQNYVMPWLDKFKTLSDVTAVFRKNALSGKLWKKAWNNIDLTPNYYGDDFYFPLIIDVVLSKLDPDVEALNITELYENTYKQGMQDYYERFQSQIEDEMDDRCLSKMADVINAMPQTIQMLENIDEAKFKAYRQKIFG